MPPSPEKKPDPEVKGLDISKILLPKKESGPNVDSAQRINAGALLAQEEGAALPKTEPKTPVRLTPTAPAPASTAPITTPAASPLGTPPAVVGIDTPPAAPAESGVKSLQTYRGDFESVVNEKGVSVVSVAAAEAERRGKQPLSQETAEEKDSRQRSWAMIIGGVALVLIALGVIAVILLRPTTVAPSAAPQAPFITVDDSVLVPVPAGQNSRDEVMTDLQAARARTKLSLGLVEWLYLAEPSSVQDGVARPISITELLGIIAPKAPPEILRTLSGKYIIGLHSFDENQPFLLMQVDSYETAYAGMLAWEDTMRSDLAPFFNRNPSPTTPGQAPVASSTPQFLQTGFVDKVVENRDTRVIQNDNGDILLLWTFLGRNAVLITTNEYTLREVLSRLTAAPVVPIPGK